MNNTFESHLTKVKESYDSSLFLGRLVWYSITGDTFLEHQEFCDDMTSIYQNAIDSNPPFLPPAPRYRDVFKRACTGAKRKNIPASPNVGYSKSNYEVKPAGTSLTEVWRVLVREDVDEEGHSLGYTELMQVSFNSDGNRISTNTYEAGYNDSLTDIIRHEILEFYKNETSNLTPYAVREYIRGILENYLYAIRVRPSGGVYFVHEQFSPIVEALESYVEQFGSKTGCDFHSLPLLDDSKQREMLRNAFEQESAGEVDRLIGEISEIIKEDKQISMGKYQSFAEEQSHLIKKVADYSDLLDTALELTGARLTMMDDLMFDLMAKVKS